MTAKDTPTSAGVWTPRYILDTLTRTSRTRHTHRSHHRRVNRATPPNTPTALWVWPLGKLYPAAPSRADSTMVKWGSRTQGRGTRQTIFSHWLMRVPVKPTASR